MLDLLVTAVYLASSMFSLGEWASTPEDLRCSAGQEPPEQCRLSMGDE